MEEESIYINLKSSNRKSNEIDDNEIYSPTKLYRKSKSTSILLSDSVNLDSSVVVSKQLNHKKSSK